MKKIFAEAGFGNSTFLSTEIEEGEREYRIPKFIKPPVIDNYYFRFWFLKLEMILATDTGLRIRHREKNKFKILFGIMGSDVQE